MLIKNICKNLHYFITKLKTKIDVIPRGCFNITDICQTVLDGQTITIKKFWGFEEGFTLKIFNSGHQIQNGWLSAIIYCNMPDI